MIRRWTADGSLVLPERPPSLAAAVVLQLRMFREAPRRWRRRAELGESALGGGRPVRVFPGMGVGDWTTWTPRRFLRRRGFDARGWGLGRHRPEVPETLERLLPRLEAWAEEAGTPVALVGWSLGGLVARECARLRPDLVRRVVTLGSPVVGGLKHTALAGFYRLQGWPIETIAEVVDAANRIPIRVPVTAIWSRRDGIIAWQACVDVETPEVENLEVDSAHWGLGLDPDVLLAVEQALAGREAPSLRQ